MIRPTAAAAVFLCVAPTDLRKQGRLACAAGRAELEARRIRSGAVCFQQCATRPDPDFVLERNGLVLWSKRLESERFIWPRMPQGDTVSMSGAQLNQLLDGFDVWTQGHRELQLKRVG